MLKKLISPYLKEQSICLTDFYVIAQLLANKFEMEFLEFKVDKFSEVKDQLELEYAKRRKQANSLSLQEGNVIDSQALQINSEAVKAQNSPLVESEIISESKDNVDSFNDSQKKLLNASNCEHSPSQDQESVKNFSINEIGSKDDSQKKLMNFNDEGDVKYTSFDAEKSEDDSQKKILDSDYQESELNEFEIV